MSLSPGRLLLPALVLLLVAVTACEDPSNVGIGLVDEQGGTPLTRTLAPEAAGPEVLGDLTGNATQVLLGAVEDLVTGAVSAEAYIDFTPPNTIPESFRTSPIDSVTLVLNRSYVYGDTTAQLRLALFDLTETWSGQNAPADTTVASAEQPLLETTVSVADTTVFVSLPDEWVTANADTLRSATFASGFLGLRLVADGGNAVVGYEATTASFLRIATEAETLEYPLGQNITRITRTAEPAPPPGTLLLQDGAGPSVRLDFDFSGAITPNDVVNRGVIRVTTDTTAFPPPPGPTFVRPSLQTLELLVVDTLGIRVPLATATRRADASYVFDTVELRAVLTDLVEGTRGNVDHFRVVAPIREGGSGPVSNTVSTLLFFDAASGQGPEAVLTVTPLDD